MFSGVLQARREPILTGGNDMNSKSINHALAASLMGVLLLAGSAAANAKGCIKGAAVGAVAGHVAGHHAIVGAAAGCAVGHHLATKGQRQQQTLPPPQPQAQPPQQPQTGQQQL
jgi:hypothetical protein